MAVVPAAVTGLKSKKVGAPPPGGPTVVVTTISLRRLFPVSRVLPAHPVVTRAEADVLAPRDRYLDLFAQARNVGYIVESGTTEKMFSEPDDTRTLDYVRGRFG